MPGFMGLRGMEYKNPHDMVRERRQEHRNEAQHELQGQERRSREKVHEILRGQDAVPQDGRPVPLTGGECDKIAQRPVTDIMSGRVAVLAFDDTLLTVEGIFSSVRFRHLPVVDDHGNIIGIISDRDFLRHVSPFYGTINEQTRDVEIMNRKVGMVMTRNPVCIDLNVTIADAVLIMNKRKISCLPVVAVGSDCLQGIITWKDIVRAFCPSSFASTDSSRLKTGVHVNPESSESARLRAKTAESARMRAAAAAASSAAGYSDRDAERMERVRPDPGQTSPSRPDARREGPPGPGAANVRRVASDTDRISISADQVPQPGESEVPGRISSRGARVIRSDPDRPAQGNEP